MKKTTPVSKSEVHRAANSPAATPAEVLSMANPTKAVTSSKLTPRLQFSCTHINRTCVFKRMGGSLGGRKNKCTHLKNVCCTINTRKNNCFVESLGASLKEFFLFSYSN